MFYNFPCAMILSILSFYVSIINVTLKTLITTSKQTHKLYVDM